MDVSIRNKYTAVIGLEVHAQLLTSSKIFNGDSTAYGSAPNTNVGVITLAHPGTLPKLNRATVECAMKMGLACNSEISAWQIFDRKNYFYPDLPKGYQITQDRTPICMGGYVTIHTKSIGKRQVGLHRIHLEEDAGKLIHLGGGTDTLADFNRSGVPLIEIVTHPELRNSEEATVFLSEIRKLVRYLNICDGNMEEGSLRCDANVSVMPVGATEFGKKVEVKNMNSIRNVQYAIDHEIERQIELLELGKSVISETRTFQASDGRTYGMRTKEELNDYRYFPDPDLSPLIISEEWLNEVKASMPTLPQQLQEKFVKVYLLPEYDAAVLTETRDIAEYFEMVCLHTGNFKAVSNWMMGPVKSFLNDEGIAMDQFPLEPVHLSSLIKLIDEGKVSFAAASQKLFPVMLKDARVDPFELAREMNLIQNSNMESLSALTDEVIKEFPLKVEEYKKGKKGIISMFMGEVMKRSKGKADPKIAAELIERKLDTL